ncbi:MAG: acyloxyacyl hydrolase [Phycisphaerales bacterium]
MTSDWRTLALCTLTLPALAAAQGPAGGSPLALRIESSPRLELSPLSQGPPPHTGHEHGPFGMAGTRWWTIGAGLGTDFDRVHDLNLPRIAFSAFVDTDMEFSVELNAWAFDQPRGENAFGLNPSMLFRWHFFNNQDWTLYGDAGVGVLFATDDVPPGGTHFNFMPRLGVGLTKQVSDSGVRLQAGVRWHHISNARITGDAKNPARDAPMFYGAIVVPF